MAEIVLILYHYPFSTHSQKVRFCLEEMNLSWESHIVDLKKQENISEDFLKINPNGMVPALVHQEKVICESNVILEYLDEVFYDNKLMPRENYAKALIRQNFVEEQSLLPYLRLLTFNWFIETNQPPAEMLESLALIHEKHPLPSQTAFYKSIVKGIKAEELELAKKVILTRLRQLDQFLEKTQTQYFIDDEFTLGDMVWAPLIHRLELLNIDVSQFKNLIHWWEKVKRRTAFIKASM